MLQVYVVLILNKNILHCTFSAPIGSDDLLYALSILFKNDVSVKHVE